MPLTQVQYGMATTLVSGTAVASTSGTSIDFTGIPSGVKRITVMFSEVSTNGSSNFQIQVGAGSVTTSGYVSRYTTGTTGWNAVSTATSGVLAANSGASTTTSGSFQFVLVTGNTWVANGVFGSSFPSVGWSTGQIALSGTLDRVRITTVNGTDTFDAGTINILYE